MVTIFNIRPKGFNLGNDVINMALLTYLYEAFGHSVNLITIPATSRYESHSKGGFSAQTVYEMNQWGDAVIVGGGNLYENNELDCDINALKALDIPLMLFSLSRGRIYNRRHELVTRTNVMPDSTMMALDKAADISLARDTATYDHFRSLGSEKVQLGGCPTIFLNRLVNRLPERPEKNRTGVLISIRHPSLMSIPLEIQARVYNDIMGIITYLRDSGYKDVRLLCHDHRDVAFAASFPNIDFVYTEDVYGYLAMLRACELNITFRLHSMLPCLSFGTKAIKISYDERAISLMDTIGMGEWNLNLVTSENLVEQVIDRVQKLKEFPERIQAAQPIWTQLDNTMRAAFTDLATLVRQNNKSGK